ncbi:MAG: tetratricopeptide repeat protein [Myxococcota bacterium]
MTEESPLHDDPEVRQALAEVERRPESARAWARLGRLLFRRARYEAAETAFRQQVQIAPDAPLGWANLALALRRRFRPQEAMAAVRRALARDPELPVARNHLAGILGDLGCYAEAVAVLRELCTENPGAVAFQANLGNALRRLRRFDEAVPTLEACLRTDPSHPSHHWNLAIACFQAGDYRRGFHHAEWRTRRPGVRPPPWLDEAWKGEPVEGPVWLVTEQGFGDAIQFVRFAEDVAARTGPVVVSTKSRLVPLLCTAPGVAQAVDSPPPPHVPRALLMSVPAALGYDVTNIGRARPYLQADPARIQRWRTRLGPARGPRIGIAWQGNPKHPEDRHRSFPLAALAPLARIPDVTLISLQRNTDVHAPFAVRALDATLDEDAAFVDTAAVMANLDLVVACDSAVAHVAGAVGCPCFLALAYAPDWRWQPGEPTTPWYSNTRPFVQSQPGVWRDVFEAMAEAAMNGVLAPEIA